MTQQQADTDPIVKTTLRLPQSLLKRAKIRAVQDGQALQDVVIGALEQFLKQKGGRQ
jgi:predicted HicB family RNase H-like nuclease